MRYMYRLESEDVCSADSGFPQCPAGQGEPRSRLQLRARQPRSDMFREAMYSMPLRALRTQHPYGSCGAVGSSPGDRRATRALAGLCSPIAVFSSQESR